MSRALVGVVASGPVFVGHAYLSGPKALAVPGIHRRHGSVGHSHAPWASLVPLNVR